MAHGRLTAGFMPPGNTSILSFPPVVLRVCPKGQKGGSFMGKVNVYNEYGEVVATVKYSENLDYWDGNNYTCGSTGRHKGLTRLKSGDYVLVHGTQWQGERDHAEIITAEEALQEILRSGNIELLEEKRFAELKELYEKTMLEEEDG
jgi:hypothetical protein